MADLSVKINDIEFKNPVLPAAGPSVRTSEMMLKALEGGAGGIVTKTVSVKVAHDSRPTIRKGVCSGLINAETWSEIPFEKLLCEYRKVKEAGSPLIISIGYSLEEVSKLGRFLEKEIQPDAIEFSTHYTGRSVEPILDVARSLKGSVDIPIWMKVSPNFPDIEKLAEKTSPFVDAFVAINSFGPVLDFDIETAEPLLGSEYGEGWLSGPPILPLALRIVYQISTATDKPVIGVGGVTSGVDAIKFFMVGASLIGVCSAVIKKGHSVYGKIAEEINDWLDEHNFQSVNEIRNLYKERLKERKTFSTQPKMNISEEDCTGCTACVNFCVNEALYMEGKVARVKTERCIGCGFCQDSCNFGAMKLK